MKNKINTIIFITCYLAYTSIYIARLNLSMASPGLTETQLLDKAQIGMLGSVFSIVYAFGRLINGYISDNKPPWLMMSLGLAAAGLSNIIIGFFPPFIGILLLWGANAYAQSMLWSPILRIISIIYDKQAAKKKTSYMVTSVAAGNILGIVLNTFIINKYGISYAFIIPGGLTLLFCTLVIPAAYNIKCVNEIKGSHISMLGLLKNHDIKTVIIPAMFHGVMKDNVSLWMTMFFVEQYNIDLSKSAAFVFFIPVIGFIGRMLYPFCYKLCKEQEHKVSAYAFAACAISAIPLCFRIIPSYIAVICLSLIYATVSLINTSILSIFPIQFLKSGNVASVSGIMDFATYFGAGISSFVYGFLIKSFGYSPMYISWAVISLISVFMLKKIIKKSFTAFE